MAKAVGLSPGHADALTQVDRPVGARRRRVRQRRRPRARRCPRSRSTSPSRCSTSRATSASTPAAWCMADRPLVEFCPIEWARMEDRSVLQWDKDDCAAAGLVKFDLLGLGMLTMLHLAVDLVREHEGVEVDLATIPQEPAVYDLLCAADTIGVFQVESRAQMATLPRLRPRTLLRPRGGGRAHPARPDPGRLGAPVPAAPQRRGAGHVPAPDARGLPAEDARRAAVPGAAHADGDRRRRVQPRRGRPAAPGHGLEALAGPHGGDARAAASPAWPSSGITGETAEEIATQARGVRRLRLPREPLGELRLPRVRELVDQAALPGRVRVARCSTRSRWASTRRTRSCATPCATGSRCSARASTASRRDCTLEPRTEGAGPVGHAASRAGTPTRRPTRCGSGLRYVRGPARRAARPHRRRACRARRSRRPRGLHPPHRRAHRRARGARHRGRVRVLRRRTRRDALWAAGALRDRSAGRRGHTLPGRGHRGGGAAVAGDDRDRGDRGRPVGDRPVGRPAPHRVRARPRSTARGVVTAEALRELPDRTVVEVGGDRHPPPAARDRQGRGVRQPRGREGCRSGSGR